MIRLSVKGLAKFITSTPRGQRKVLHDFKYPDDDEPAAMRLYYKDATDRIYAYHNSGHDSTWLQTKVKDLGDLAQLTPGRAGTRLRHNARALASYEKNFSTRQFTDPKQLRLRIDFGAVTITATPDLYVSEKGKPKIVKLDFAKEAPSDETVKIISQTMFEAAKGVVPGVTGTSVLYLDVPRGTEHRGAKAGSRMLREIEDACKSIEALWPGI